MQRPDEVGTTPEERARAGADHDDDSSVYYHLPTYHPGLGGYPPPSTRNRRISLDLMIPLPGQANSQVQLPGSRSLRNHDLWAPGRPASTSIRTWATSSETPLPHDPSRHHHPLSPDAGGRRGGRTDGRGLDGVPEIELAAPLRQHLVPSPAATAPLTNRDDFLATLQPVEMEAEDCPICYKPYETAVKLPCGHTYCDKCIKTWLHEKNTCPMDRKILFRQTRPWARSPLDTFASYWQLGQYNWQLGQYNSDTGFLDFVHSMRFSHRDTYAQPTATMLPDLTPYAETSASDLASDDEETPWPDAVAGDGNLAHPTVEHAGPQEG